MKKIITLTLLCWAQLVIAQKIKVIEGNLKMLKGQTSIITEFTYDNMIIGKNKTEAAYIAEKKEELNKKEAGRGDSWEQKWVEDRTSRFEPQFRELFAKHAGMTTADDNSKYTMIFKTKRTEPGWNVGVMRVPAYIDAEIWIVETSNKEKALAKISVLKSPGRDAWGFDFETGVRIQESYAKAGKSVGKLFAKSK